MSQHTSNTELLTSSFRSKSKKGKSRGISIVFDDKSRMEYLTGFQKRNKERKKKYQEKQEMLKKAEKCEKRRAKRKQIHEILSEYAKTEAVSNQTRSEEQGPTSCELKFLDSETVTTVVVESLE